MKSSEICLLMALLSVLGIALASGIKDIFTSGFFMIFNILLILFFTSLNNVLTDIEIEEGNWR